MPANYVLLEKITVGAAGASSVTFSNIPQTGYTDLVVKVSARTDRADVDDMLDIRPNGSTSNRTFKYVRGDGGAVTSASVNRIYIDGSSATSNTFGTTDLYFTNYSGSTYKSISIDTALENNATLAYAGLQATLWSDTTAISSLVFAPLFGTNFVSGSTFYLYGVAKLGTTPAIQAYATGGDIIETDGTYWYHAFLSSGTFTPTKGISADVLVVAGGGGGGGDLGGGGGAGGVIAFATQALASGTGYTATIGAGGAGAATSGSAGTAGNNSTFAALTAAVGGGRGGQGSTAASNGGSGGGAPRNSTAKGTGTSGQGFDGGIGTSGQDAAGSGGGAGAVGNQISGGVPPVGGAGTNTVTNWGALSTALTTLGLGVSGYIAGGGGIGGYAYAPTPYSGTAGGSGGGGNNPSGQVGGSPGVNGNPGVANTGSGGAGGSAFSGLGGAGGSGLVIVRYAV